MKRFIKTCLSNEAVRLSGSIIIVFVLYLLTVEAFSQAVARRAEPKVTYGPLHGFLKDLSDAPPLARWDSVWYYGIAIEGYSGNPHASGFLPLYPLLMRFVARLFAIHPFEAGLWISRTATLVSLFLLAEYVRAKEPKGTPRLPPVLTLLAFPSAFILISVYSESLFLATVLATFVLAYRGWNWTAAVAAFAAGMTRIHGLALMPALVMLGCSQWQMGKRSFASFAPAVGVAVAYLSLSTYYALEFGDPLRYFTAKRAGFDTKFSPPWETLAVSITRLDLALSRDALEALYIGLEFPCLCLLVMCILLLCELRRWPEAVFVAGGAAMSLFAGSLWGLPRFVLSMFPAFTVLAMLQRRRFLWWIYLLCSVLFQAANLVQYVNFGLPAP